MPPPWIDVLYGWCLIHLGQLEDITVTRANDRILGLNPFYSVFSNTGAVKHPDPWNKKISLNCCIQIIFVRFSGSGSSSSLCRIKIIAPNRFFRKNIVTKVTLTFIGLTFQTDIYQLGRSLITFWNEPVGPCPWPRWCRQMFCWRATEWRCWRKWSSCACWSRKRESIPSEEEQPRVPWAGNLIWWCWR